MSFYKNHFTIQILVLIMLSLTKSRILSGTGNNQEEQPKKKVLLIIDVQNDFILEDAPLKVSEGADIIQGINDLMKNYQFDYVVASQDWHPEDHISFSSSTQEGHDNWPPHCLQGSDGAKLHANLNTEPIHFIIKKGYKLETDSYSAFLDAKGEPTRLHNLFSEKNESETSFEMYVVGIATDYCVKFTALDSKQLGFNTFIIGDLTRGVNQQNKDEVYAEVRGKEIKVIQTSELDNYLTKRT